MQDLQSQLADAKQQINQLRNMLRDGGVMDLDAANDTPTLKLPDVVPNHERRHGPPVTPNFDHVRNNIRIYGRGIFKAPPPYRQIPPLPLFSLESPSLPPKHFADKLLSQYYGSVHRTAPLLHWPTFHQDFEKVYAAGTLRGVPQIWVSLFFAVLACGTLQHLDRSPGFPRPDVQGREYVDIVNRFLNTRTDEVTIDHARTTLLLSVYSWEMNYKSSAWIWLGSSVRMAQDIGLHWETGPWPLVEGEMRRRVWWAIYAWDRYEIHSLFFARDRCPVPDYVLIPTLWSENMTPFGLCLVLSPDQRVKTYSSISIDAYKSLYIC